MLRSPVPIGAVAATMLCMAGAVSHAAESTSADAALDAKVKAAAESRGREVSIPFADRGGIWNWRAVDRDTLLIEARNRKWYRAELTSGCFDLPFAQQIGFKANPSGDFDRFSSVVVRGQNCRVVSLTETAPPPKRGKQAAAGTDPRASSSGAAREPAKPTPP